MIKNSQQVRHELDGITSTSWEKKHQETPPAKIRQWRNTECVPSKMWNQASSLFTPILLNILPEIPVTQRGKQNEKQWTANK